ncbi:PQ loop repeat-domain-containing protein [Yarrowia lipolytica]|uniref:YALI0F05060p n=2 Tax=Yarrowia lipolytica TaxID=4952 RepID=Q6C2U6_YARLI|nr:YALI0F05060p [Yarrowia lipolytica CLIB122]AOW06682.1 hypothetical protein YALI1_F07655g [Yarrowia lipolytica]KAJ8056100.1 PQ loop repeat-domain-containing protein [Yarrowia lipolytica]QNQ00554.1 Putative vacuolar amino acid transporter YPQ1 [Yarrowia lipolytica]RDW27317.1 PQ loop repeat-domain-containing protein [Yarrowia lipolytica]RDW30469.1 PQ loop repeat-domain-containing protein [Yarrowia lipolytica]|eukprot:XP_505016.1 YALI0F05060p [Yarrowia lipolytica CLIB122]
MDAVYTAVQPPIHGLDSSALSGIMGCISIACWIIVFTPQIYENFKRQSSEGLSLSFVVIWLIGDIFNVLGAILQKIIPTMIILAIYYTLADILLLLQCLVYTHRNKMVDLKHLSPATPLLEADPSHDAEPRPAPVTEPVPRAKVIFYRLLMVATVIAAGILGYVFSSNNHKDGKPEKPHDDPLEMNMLGQFFGWLCAAFYLGSRVPQIVLNYERKSCEGISFMFFLFACLGNLTAVASILLKDTSRQYLIINASWLLGAIGTLFLDFVIFCQFWIYGE